MKQCELYENLGERDMEILCSFDNFSVHLKLFQNLLNYTHTHTRATLIGNFLGYKITRAKF